MNKRPNYFAYSACGVEVPLGFYRACERMTREAASLSGEAPLARRGAKKVYSFVPFVKTARA
jgi:hypothetical protein